MLGSSRMNEKAQALLWHNNAASGTSRVGATRNRASTLRALAPANESYIQNCDNQGLQSDLGPGAGDMSEVAPELLFNVPGLKAPPPLERFRIQAGEENGP